MPRATPAGAVLRAASNQAGAARPTKGMLSRLRAVEASGAVGGGEDGSGLGAELGQQVLHASGRITAASM